ncbi:E3 ubiquitin-protein ligase RNF8-like [Battus philenor]|uniref:E3 ubiquitin-protein ligase RNF8-like n=1 Tax=Battus philenor TaxID=42288 RepID=UPI0035CFF68B
MQENNVPYLICNKTLKPEFNKFQKILVTSSEFSIGRGLGNSLVIPYLSISKNHCIIRKTNIDVWFIEDSSSFGIEINGVRLGKGNKRKLNHRDVISLEPSQAFLYTFIDRVQVFTDNDNSFESPQKRIKLEANNDANDIISDVKMKFEQSQCCEIKNIEEKINNAKQMQKNSKILKDHLQIEMTQKMQSLQNYYTTRIESLEGEKSAVEKQKAVLIVERDKQLATLKKEMEEKIHNLKKQIENHNDTESELIIENNLLKQKLLKEREEFLRELNRESSSKKDMLEKLEAKIREQEETRLKEKKELQETLRKETERLKVAKEKELKELEQQKKTRELELLHEYNKLKKNLESKMEKTEQQKCKVEQMLNHKMEQMKKVNEEEKIKMEKLVNEREELHKKLAEAKLNADKSIVELKTRVQDRETELAALAAERIQKHSEQSTEVINSLLEQLDKVKSQLRTVENEKEMLKAVNETGETSTKENNVVEFTDIMENELQCSICAELFVTAITLSCSHTFCKYCITEWKKKKRDCPICRAPILSECKSLVLDSFIDKMVENLSTEMKQKRLNLLKSREEEVKAMTKPTSTKTPIRVTGSRGRSRGRRRSTRTSTSTTTSDQQGNEESVVERIPIVDLTTPPQPPVIALTMRSRAPVVYQTLEIPEIYPYPEQQRVLF